MAIVANPTLSDGTDTLELQMEDFNFNPNARVAQQEIVGGQGDKTSGMGRGNYIISGTVVIHKGTPINSSAAGDIDDAEDLLTEWAEENTVLTYTEDDGSTTWQCMIRVDFDKPRDVTPVLIRGNIEIIEAEN